jgi:hypothetical protein
MVDPSKFFEHGRVPCPKCGLFPHLAELAVQVAVHRELPKVQRAYQGYLRRRRDAHRVGVVQPTAGQQGVEKLFPAVAQLVRGYGHIEVGDQETFGFVARALGYGNLAKYVEREAIELEE